MNEIKIISELCGQFGGSIRRAEQMILQSKIAGSDYVKIQLYDTFRMPGENRQLWEYLSIDKDMFVNIKRFSDVLNMPFFASVFHDDRLQWTQQEGLKINKIASSLLKNDFNLCKKIVDTGNLTFCSLGQWDKLDYPFKSNNVIYMHCVCEYPHSFLRAIELMPEKFEYPMIGYSDHCIGIEASKEAVRRGAIYIEKHFTVNHDLQSKTEGAHVCSMNMNELIKLRNFCDEYVR
jgi:sialic acid synthase SpsE